MRNQFEDSNGARVKLDLVETTNVIDFGLFPGQIVVIQGIRSNGRVFVVQKLIPFPVMHNCKATIIPSH
jgi:hypothetical protein